MSDLVRRVEETVARHRLLEDGDAVLVAVSGGVDSMVLLHLLSTLAARHRWKLIVAHFNHRLRGNQAGADERLVARTAKRLGLRCEIARGDVKLFARERKLSLEMAARALRHDFLARTARALGVPKVALAHHADDQVELFFLRLLRGAGSDGLGGMRWQSKSPVDKAISLVRPLLRESKEALTEFAREQRIVFREDATNRSTDILRNRIRGELLPRLRRSYQPRTEVVVLRAMELLRDEAQFIGDEAARWRSAMPEGRSAFTALPVALQRRVLQFELRHEGISADFDLLEKLRLNADEWCSIGAELFCRRRTDGKVETRSAPGTTFREAELRLNLQSASKRAAFASARLCWSFRPGGTLLRTRAAGTEFFDAKRIGDEIVLRHWRAGDRFQPIGMKRAVKLQDLFVNQKIARGRRHDLLIATTPAGEIFWVEGLRIGERFKVTSETRQMLRWKVLSR